MAVNNNKKVLQKKAGVGMSACGQPQASPYKTVH